MNIARFYNIACFRRSAKRRLPRAIFDFLDGAADDEVTLRRNSAAFDDYEIIPRHLTSLTTVNTTTKVLGTTLEWPVLLSPTGSTQLFHPDRELAVARAAAMAGTLYSLSTMSTTSIEDIAAASQGPHMFQIFIYKDRGITASLVERCKAARYTALCLTVDAAVGGNRERDRMNGLALRNRAKAQRFAMRNFLSFAMHPAWSLRMMRNADFRMANFIELNAPDLGPMSRIEDNVKYIDPAMSWRDAEQLAAQWSGPFVIKGIQSVEDARRAQDVGASAIMISNHGGRQLDGVPAPVDCVAPIRDALGSKLEIIVDGGVRRGTHVLKALALGANACSIGRPYLYGLASAGQYGVERVLALLRAEIERGMALMGCGQIADIDGRFTMRRWSGSGP